MTTATLTRPAPRPAVRPDRRSSRRALHLPGAGVLGLASAAVLVPWIAYLARSLPTSYLLTGWSAAWVGFDVLLAAVLAVTGLLARRRHPLWPSAAFGSASLLVADAWFDVMTSGSGGLLVPVLSAALLELPLAALLVHHAVRATRTATNHTTTSRTATAAHRTITDHVVAQREGAAVEG